MPVKGTAILRQLGVYFHVGQSQKRSCTWEVMVSWLSKSLAN